MVQWAASDLRESRARCELAEWDRCSCLLWVVVITELSELSSPARAGLQSRSLAPFDAIYPSIRSGCIVPSCQSLRARWEQWEADRYGIDN